MHADDGGQGGVRRSRLLGLLVGASRPNPRPFSSSAPSATTRDDDDDDLLSRCRLRIPRKSGRAASAVERWAQERGHVSQPELRHAVVRLRHARRYEQALEYEKVLSIIDLMKRNNIPRNVMSYNIWMNACAEVSGVASVQSAFKEMLNDDMVEVGWSTYCTLANIFRKYGQNSKALACLRKAETKLSVTGRLGPSGSLEAGRQNAGNMMCGFQMFSLVLM
ncbi:hypothetical protein E2562_009793 [Oryza meyeriana var. granulata]|uniref:Pentacotripeptide-repeat region of PRORP domain-containing protein n=1 Tax=Oryza meyeriana var. granulata TaxID=110450 RepID=A0A6G1EAY1_9ORYZ|nr:hypothetical protein E2562_009793 [Oryza meyeriana var. granulata]